MSNSRQGCERSFSASIFSTSFFATLIVIVVIGTLMLIAYRVESTLGLDPIIIFTLTDHSNGDFSFTFLNFQGEFSLKWLYELKDKLAFGELFIPQSAKTINQIVNNAADCIAYLIDRI